MILHKDWTLPKIEIIVSTEHVNDKLKKLFSWLMEREYQNVKPRGHSYSILKLSRSKLDPVKQIKNNQNWKGRKKRRLYTQIWINMKY